MRTAINVQGRPTPLMWVGANAIVIPIVQLTDEAGNILTDEDQNILTPDPVPAP